MRSSALVLISSYCLSIVSEPVVATQLRTFLNYATVNRAGILSDLAFDSWNAGTAEAKLGSISPLIHPYKSASCATFWLKTKKDMTSKLVPRKVEDSYDLSFSIVRAERLVDDTA